MGFYRGPFSGAKLGGCALLLLSQALPAVAAAGTPVRQLGAASAADTNGWTAAAAEVCGFVLSLDADTDCRAQCTEQGKFDPEKCRLAVDEDGVAADCALPWAYGGPILAESDSEDPASCQGQCQKTENCAQFEFRSATKKCLLRDRLQMNSLTGGGGECETDMRCDKLFESECTTCYGRRVCMRRDEGVFSGPRLCMAEALREEDRCIPFGFAWPLTHLTSSYEFDPTPSKCAEVVTADPVAAPPGACKLPVAGFGADWNELPLVHVNLEHCHQLYGWRNYVKDGDENYEDGLRTYLDCQKACENDTECLAIEWKTEDSATMASGRCGLRYWEIVGRENKGPQKKPEYISSAPRCRYGKISFSDRDPPEDVWKATPEDYGLKEGQHRAEDLRICERLVPRAETSTNCKSLCDNSLTVDANDCGEAATEDLRASGCATAARGALRVSVAGEEVDNFLSDARIGSLSDCASQCLQNPTCVVWEVYRDEAGAPRCALKTRSHVQRENRAAADGDGAAAAVCRGQRTSISADASAFRGAAACAVAYASAAEVADSANCLVPHVRMQPHELVISGSREISAKDCAAAAAADLGAPLPEGCVYPESLTYIDDVARADVGSVADLKLGADECIQQWGYLPLIAAAASDVSVAECQDACRRAGDGCVYWMWEWVSGTSGKCHLRSAEQFQSALTGHDLCEIPEGGTRLEGASCVFSHWKIVSAPLECPEGPRDPLSLDDVVKTSSTTKAPPAAAGSTTPGPSASSTTSGNATFQSKLVANAPILGAAAGFVALCTGVGFCCGRRVSNQSAEHTFLFEDAEARDEEDNAP